jgi:alkanesulfonate monooxygenase SsuD/methylene tetrahydromethanopterin reductase-like flavin-dependent oxidoreductase (luciferase family)
MQIGIGFPASIPNTPAETLLDWARRADAGPFSSLGVIDRLVYPNYEPLIALAAAAGATQRIRLMTTVLRAPLRNGAMLAKQAASLDALSGGRLVLGLGVGNRQGDFAAAGVSFQERGRRFEQQLDLMRRIWNGQPVSNEAGRIGPSPARHGGPELLIGGYTPAALRRVGLWGDGYISGGTDANTARQLYGMVEESWKAAGRSGKPRIVAAAYWALGPDAERGVAAYLGDYYSFLPNVQNMIGAVPKTPEALKAVIQSYVDAGADELILWPCVPTLDQVDRLADLVR